MGALAYLTVVSVVNRIRVRLRRLREVRYAAGMLAGLLYFYFVLGGGRTGSRGVYSALSSMRGAAEMVGAVALFAIVCLGWALPSKGKAALLFTQAEVHLLFPAPFSRRQLIAYKLLRLQAAGFMSSLIMTVFFRPGSIAAGWTFLAGVMVVTSLLTVHLIAVGLARASLIQHGRRGLAHQWLPLALVFGAVAVLGGTLAEAWPSLATLPKRQLLAELETLSTTGLAGAILWPFRAAVQLPLSSSPSAFFARLPVPLGLLGLNFLWAIRSDAAFEEASAELAEKVAHIRSGKTALAGTIKKRRPPFQLATTGRPEIALLWKNLIMLGRFMTLKRTLVFLPTLVVIAVIGGLEARDGRYVEVLAMLSLMLAFATVFFGPMVIRNDLRKDLESVAMLKSWPLTGAEIVRGEVLAPVVALTMLAWIFILGASASLAHTLASFGVGTASTRFSWLLAALLVAPALIAAQVLTQNAIAVLFPAWASIGPARGHGIDMMGQRMLLFVGILLSLVAALLPAALLGAAAAGLVYLLTGTVTILLPAFVIALSLAVEWFAGTELLGRAMDRTDPAAIDPVE